MDPLAEEPVISSLPSSEDLREQKNRPGNAGAVVSFPKVDPVHRTYLGLRSEHDHRHLRHKVKKNHKGREVLHVDRGSGIYEKEKNGIRDIEEGKKIILTGFICLTSFHMDLDSS